MSTHTFSRIALSMALAAVLAACDSSSNKQTAAAPVDTSSWPELLPAGSYQEMDWEALMPSDWKPEAALEGVDLDTISDDDPRAEEIMAQLTEAWSDAPVVPELDGQAVRLPGFVVPLEADTEKVSEFLLVPYYGACIHVPPPPLNQTVHVITRPGKEYTGELFDTVWVSGTLKVEAISSELADAGYQLRADTVELLR